jgi:hypothetical protein
VIERTFVELETEVLERQRALLGEAARERLARRATRSVRPPSARRGGFRSRLAAALVALAAHLDESYAEATAPPGRWAGAA